MNTENFKSGFVTIIGKPNVGKSTLMNRLIGEKLSIVSPKPQTTRHEIKGILNTKDCQIIFLDTPGFLEPRYELQRKMMDYIKTALRDADLIIFITDANHFPTDYDEKMLHLIKNIKIPKLALLNKIDLVDEKSAGLSYEQLCQYDFDQVKKVSILHDENLDELEEVIQNYMPYNPPYYSPDELSDLPMRFFAQEIIREQIFLLFKDEIPYSATVVVEKYEEFPNKTEIAANIWLERRSQKIILIGSNGEKIKNLRLKAEKEFYKISGKRTKLNLWIKIKPNWRKKKNALKEFGYH